MQRHSAERGPLPRQRNTPTPGLPLAGADWCWRRRPCMWWWRRCCPRACRVQGGVLVAVATYTNLERAGPACLRINASVALGDKEVATIAAALKKAAKDLKLA